GVPLQHDFGFTPVRIVGARWLFRVGEDIVAADGLVAPVQKFARPFADEYALGRSPLIARAVVHGPPPLRAPADDLYRACLRIVNEKSVAFERGVRSIQDRHAAGPQSDGEIGVEVVGHPAADLA